MQGIITSLHLATTLPFGVLRRWSLYLNRYGTASSSEDVGALGSTVPFSIVPILLELQCGIYVGPLLLEKLAYLISGRCRGGSGSDVGGGKSSGGAYNGSN